MKRILVTGGAGYIGSHTCISLLSNGFEVTVLDNLSNSSINSIDRVMDITGKSISFVEGDVSDTKLVSEVMKINKTEAVIHFAGLKAVGESVEKPLRYYHANISGTLSLSTAMMRNDITNMVFSSSCTVYGNPNRVPVTEDETDLRPTNPYGFSKLVAEKVLTDITKSSMDWSVGILRYFNPVGAHESGLLGEDPRGTPGNLVPFITQVAVGQLDMLRVFGKDYSTFDGTGVRDYIHVMDLAEGHLQALKAIKKTSGVNIWNLGSGQGYSVLEVVQAFEKIIGKPIPLEFTDRRPGDVAMIFADPKKARTELNWSAKRDLTQMVQDAWRWQSANPQGFQPS